MFLLALGSFLLFAAALAVRSGHLAFPGLRTKSLPPGPPTLLFIGNMHQIPRTGIHLKLTEWAAKYGPLYSLKVGNGTTVVISSPRYVRQLLDKLSVDFSYRPPLYILNDLVFHGNHSMLMSPGDRWRLRRKLFHQLLMEKRCEQEHIRLIEAESVQMLHDFVLDSNDCMEKIPKRFSNSIIMSLVFGVRTPSRHSSHMKKLYDIMLELSKISEIGATPPVDLLGVFKYIPEKLWGSWRTRAQNLSQMMTLLYGPLVEHVLQRRSTGRVKTSFLDEVLNQQEKLQLRREEINTMCGNLVEGGSDSVGSMMLAFIQAMLAFPDVQKRAQEELDAVVGESRMPTWADYAQLPYVAMIVKETMRWRPVVPGAFPHAAAKEHVIDGMTIPKGATVLLNTWGLHHDPSVHPSPDTFDPMRYEDRTLLAPEYTNHENRDHYGYGAGRRICPGLHLSERAMFIGMARMLWAFTIAHKLDAQGSPIPVITDARDGYEDGLLQCPRAFEAAVTPRSTARRDLIVSSMPEAEREVFSVYTEEVTV
ncbi:Cytochrome P450 2F2 [Talaromyces islandicus]|uniref:Cytochrome P450 2F2 n=1 Tax=Talaromyces islandicus TaxID=28573 RepID=A0A0U1M9X6_TALIS|nr:Cytochrome P450 2F2 [Talaromyces islandicus]